MTYRYEEGYRSGFLSEIKMNHNIKDSVFRKMLSMAEFRLEFYSSLFPNKSNVKAEEIEEECLRFI